MTTIDDNNDNDDDGNDDDDDGGGASSSSNDTVDLSHCRYVRHLGKIYMIITFTRNRHE